MIKGLILDLDGTVYRGEEEVPGAGRFVAAMNDLGVRSMFVTNRANRAPEEVCTQLKGLGIPCEPDDVLTSAQVTGMHLGRGSAFCVGEEGMRAELEKAGMVITEDSPDYVVVGFDRAFTYEKLKKACRFIDAGAKFVATNPDANLRIAEGLVPGTGAIVAAVATVSGKQPLVIGKPGKYIVELALSRLGMATTEALVVGDNLEMDIPAGAGAGARTVLILTGISARDDLEGAAVQPTWVVDNYDELETIIRSENTV